VEMEVEIELRARLDTKVALYAAFLGSMGSPSVSR
jgi:hypothetical protein